MIENAASVILASATVLGLILVLQRIGKKETGKRHPPSLPALPFVGSIPFLRSRMDDLPEQFLRLSKKLGPVFSFYSGRSLAFVLNGKQAIVDALLKHGEAFADRPDFWTEANILNPELRGSCQQLDIRIWKEVERMNKTICDYRCRPFNPKALITRSTANVVMNMLFGEEFQSMEKELHSMVDSAHEHVENCDPAIHLAPLIRFLPLYRKKISKMSKAKEIVFDGIEVAIKQIKSNKQAEDSFVKRFLEIEGSNYDHQDLLFILRDICSASSDSVLLGLLWALVEMANHPEIKTRVRKEIDEMIPGDRFPSYDDILRLPYTEATLLEVARIHTLAPLAVPHATSRDTKVLEYFIPKGSLIIANLYSAHMDPDTWTDPTNFRPERFLDEDQNIVGREKLLQFSIGKRACPGESLAKHEVFVFFCSLMQHFDLQPPDGQDSITVTNDSGLASSPTPFEMKFLPRKKS